MRRHILVVLFTSLVTVTTGTAEAAAPESWKQLRSEIAAAYPPIATADGRFNNYLFRGGIPQSNPMLGYGLIQAGLATGSGVQIDTGLRTLTSFAVHGPTKPSPGVFDHFALASAYNLARGELAERPEFAAARRHWESRLRGIPLFWLPNTSHYANKYMVEVVAVLESRRTGLSSRVSKSVLAEGRRAERLAVRVLDQVAPSIARNASTSVAGAPALVLSDPSNNALAYHALTLGFFARAVDLLGPRASKRAREALQRVARASWAATAPDGDLAYIGRSQQQGWALALSAYGAEVAAADADATWAPRFRAVADRAIARLLSHHGVGPYGLWITPSGADASRVGRHGLDTYAHGVSYGGLALIGLNWAIEHAERHDRTVGAIGSDGPGAAMLGTGRMVFHAVRTEGSWFAVKRSRAAAARDLRYDFGLVALKRPAADGRWVDVVRPRPHTTSPDSAGPVLLGPGARGLPDGTSSSTSRTGAVTVRGGYRSLRGQWLRRGETFRFAPVACGVKATFTRRSGRKLAYSVFFRETPTVDGGHVTGGGIDVQASPAPVVHFRNGYASGADARLVRAELRFPAGETPVEVTICDG